MTEGHGSAIITASFYEVIAVKTVWIRVISLALCLMLVMPLLPRIVRAQEEQIMAQQLPVKDILTAHTGYGYQFIGLMYDTVEGRSTVSQGDASLTLECAEGIGSLYFIFAKEYGEYTVTDNATGQVHTFGGERFLHDFLDLEQAFGKVPTSITVRFDQGPVSIIEIYAYTAGQVPSSVQKWRQPKEGKTDLILFSTHGDDEQLFFAGLLPTYARELGYEVLVVYLTDHRSHSPHRVHEMLNGLWSVGVTAYPVLGPFLDFFQDNKEDTYKVFRTVGTTRDGILAYVVEQLRRYRPQVVIGHDFAGEYGHGQHMVYAEVLASALKISNDPAAFPKTAEQYGVWDVPKAYFHLYRENPIVLDWDQPLESFDGMTAFEVTKELGFRCHVSQIPAFWYWIGPYEKAADIPTYSPCRYGLYRTTVGPDVNKNDFFENLTSYAEQERLAEEAKLAREAHEAEKDRLTEELRLAKEEQARREAQAEAERIAREEEQLGLQEQQRLQAQEEARLAAEAEAKRDRILLIGGIVGGIAVLALIGRILYQKSKPKIFV